jgi:hypothetical protein
VWTQRGRDSVYRPGEEVIVRFRVSDDAYVCVYNIDTEGNLRVLFPLHPAEDGYVEGGRVYTLPAPYTGIEYVVAGPPGIEHVAIVASRYPLDLPWAAEAGYGPHGVSAYLDEEEDWDEGWYEEDEASWYDEYEWQAWHEGGAIELAWTDEGYPVTGDPFVAMRRVNGWLVPRVGARHVTSDYSTLYVERRYSYPRYVCADCHGPRPVYDPYHDRCSVFSVRVNAGWVYQPWHVRVVHYRPRYVYVRHTHVPAHYRHLKRQWPSHQRRIIAQQFRRRPADLVPKTKHPAERSRIKSKRGYDWKSPARRSKTWSAPSPKPTEKGYRSKDQGRPVRKPPARIDRRAAGRDKVRRDGAELAKRRSSKARAVRPGSKSRGSAKVEKSRGKAKAQPSVRSQREKSPESSYRSKSGSAKSGKSAQRGKREAAKKGGGASKSKAKR